MSLSHEGLKKEFEYVTKPSEQNHIGSALENLDPLMQEIAYELITGNNSGGDTLTKKALEDLYKRS